jgi:hypothetical protein
LASFTIETCGCSGCCVAVGDTDTVAVGSGVGSFLDEVLGVAAGSCAVGCGDAITVAVAGNVLVAGTEVFVGSMAGTLGASVAVGSGVAVGGAGVAVVSMLRAGAAAAAESLRSNETEIWIGLIAQRNAPTTTTARVLTSAMKRDVKGMNVVPMFVELYRIANEVEVGVIAPRRCDTTTDIRRTE